MMTLPLIVPEVGIYRGIPDGRYHGLWDAASNSRLTLLKRSPAHLRASIDNPRKETPALRLGRAIHTALLEPERFAATYALGPIGDRRTKAIQMAWAEAELRVGPGNVLHFDEWECCLKLAKSVRRHDGARTLLDAIHDFEVSLAWDDAETGIRCKARVDGLAPELMNGTIVDVKSTVDASPEEFARSIFNYGYHRQAAHYMDAAAALGIAIEHFAFIAVEKEPPFAIGTYELREEDIALGRDELRFLRARYAKCLADNEWPAYSNKIEFISLPLWARSRSLELLEVA